MLLFPLRWLPLLGLALLLTACSRKEEEKKGAGAPVTNGFVARQTLEVDAGGPRVPSPSGRYTLVIVPTDKRTGSDVLRYYDFQVWEGERVVLESREEFAGWFPLWFGWDAQDRVWAGSADVGVSWWERGPDGWQQGTWERGHPLTPPTDTAVWVSR